MLFSCRHDRMGSPDRRHRCALLLPLLLVAALLLWLAQQQPHQASPTHDGCPRPKPRVALCFYGLNRALRHTVPSIADNVWKPLHDACATIDVYYHVWRVPAAYADTAARGGERLETKIDGAAEMVRLLRPFGARRYIERQDSFDAAFSKNASAYAALDKRYGGPNFRNLMRQLASLKRVSHLWRTSGHTYRAVIYARPDLRFLDPIDAGQVLSIKPRTLLVPYWHRWSGLNDRVIVAAPDAAAFVGDRLAHAPRYAARTFLRAEAFLAFVARTHNLHVEDLALRAQRVRADGAVASNDRCLQYCSPALRDVCRGDCRSLALEPAPLAAHVGGVRSSSHAHSPPPAHARDPTTASVHPSHQHAGAATPPHRLARTLYRDDPSCTQVGGEAEGPRRRAAAGRRRAPREPRRPRRHPLSRFTEPRPRRREVQGKHHKGAAVVRGELAALDAPREPPVRLEGRVILRVDQDDALRHVV